MFYPKIHVKSAILALNHALSTIKTAFPSSKVFNLFTIGYSWGASYALWLEKCLESKQNCQGASLNEAYIYKGACGLSGAYDLF